MSNEVIPLFTPEGEAKDYRKFSARLPEFLKAFPKEKGYRVKIDVTDPLSHKPGLIQLYSQALAQGKTPVEMGLPPLPAGDVMVFTATLYDPEGNALETASALRLVINYKDWEKGETAARQRLISALGFGGDCFDSDELSDIGDQGLSVKSGPSNKAKPDQEAVVDAAPKGAFPANEQAAEEIPREAKEDFSLAQSDSQEKTGKPEELQVDDQATSTQVDEVAEPVSQTAKSPSVDGESNAQNALSKEDIPDRIVRQIVHQAKIKNVTPEPYSTVKEAKLELKRLMGI